MLPDQWRCAEQRMQQPVATLQNCTTSSPATLASSRALDRTVWTSCMQGPAHVAHVAVVCAAVIACALLINKRLARHQLHKRCKWPLRLELPLTPARGRQRWHACTCPLPTRARSQITPQSQRNQRAYSHTSIRRAAWITRERDHISDVRDPRREHHQTLEPQAKA